MLLETCLDRMLRKLKYTSALSILVKYPGAEVFYEEILPKGDQRNTHFNDRYSSASTESASSRTVTLGFIESCLPKRDCARGRLQHWPGGRILREGIQVSTEYVLLVQDKSKFLSLLLSLPHPTGQKEFWELHFCPWDGKGDRSGCEGLLPPQENSPIC